MELKTVWCVKYAFTQGIFPLTGCFTGEDHRYFSERRAGNRIGYFLSSKEVCASPEEALEVAEQLRATKIASLEKRVEKLRSMEVKVVRCREG